MPRLSPPFILTSLIWRQARTRTQASERLRLSCRFIQSHIHRPTARPTHTHTHSSTQLHAARLGKSGRLLASAPPLLQPAGSPLGPGAPWGRAAPEEDQLGGPRSLHGQTRAAAQGGALRGRGAGPRRAPRGVCAPAPGPARGARGGQAQVPLLGHFQHQRELDGEAHQHFSAERADSA